MRLKNSPALFLQLTGLYIPRTEDKMSCRRVRAIALAFFLIVPSVLYFFRAMYNIWKIFGNYSIKDVEYVVIVGWQFQSIIGISTMGYHRFDSVYRIIAFYQQFVINCVMSYFVTSVRCLTMQLQEFNRELEQLLQSPSKESDFADRLMGSFSVHQTLARKVREMDKIFRVFIFCILASGVPMMVFGTITLIRRETLLSFILAVYDFIFCIVQLAAFTIVPAQLYAELHAVPSHIYWSPVIWRHFDPHLFQIARSFSENVKNLSVGLSFGGLAFIKKSSILMAFILIVPYVILSYQLYVDSGKNYRNFNMIAKSMNKTF